MTQYPKSFIVTILNNVALSTIVGEVVKLKKHGQEYSGLCPFHQEKTPSFTVTDQKAFYHCFGCGAHGNAIDFLMKSKNFTFPEAIKDLAIKANIPLPKDTEEAYKQHTKETQLHEALEAAINFYTEHLLSNHGSFARQYLENRGISRKTIAKFRLGLAPEKGNMLCEILKNQGFSPHIMQEAGLIMSSEAATMPKDRFRSRLMIPIIYQKKCVGFGGRLLKDNQQAPKYLNSPETTVFQKGNILFNYDIARNLKNTPLVLVEGYLDVISLDEHGFTTSVAPLGTSVTEEHLNLIWKISRKPIICFDADQAGISAQSRIIEKALPYLAPEKTLYFISLPEQEDPDSFIKSKGLKAWLDLTSNPVPLVYQWITLEKKKYNLHVPEEIAHFESSLLKKITKIQNSSVQKHYRRILEQEIFTVSRVLSFQKPKSASLKILRPKIQEDIHERLLIILLLQYPFLIEDIEEQLTHITFQNHSLEHLKRSIQEYFFSGHPLEKQALHNYLKEHDHTQSLLSLLHEKTYIHAPFLRHSLQKEEVWNYWKKSYWTYIKDQIAKDITELKKELEQNFSEENWIKYQELQKEYDSIKE